MVSNLYVMILAAFFMPVQFAFAQSLPRDDRKPKEILRSIANTWADTNRIKFELELGYYYVTKPGAFKTDMDSALTVFEPALQLSRQLRSKKWENETLKLMGDCYLEQHDIPHGSAYFMQVINYYRLQKNKKDEAFTWLRFGQCIPTNDTTNIKARRAALDNAKLLFKQLHDVEHELTTLQEIAEHDIDIGRFDEAKAEFSQIIAHRNIISNESVVAAYSSLADLGKAKGHQHTELYYRLEAIKQLGSSDDNDGFSFLYYQLGQTYFDLRMYGNSLISYQKALSFKGPGATFDYGIYLALVRVLIVLNRSSEALHILKDKVKTLPKGFLYQDRMLNKAFGYCYDALNEFDKAEKYYLETIRIDSQAFIEDAFVEARNYENDYNDICEFYIKFKKYQKADACLKHFTKLKQSRLSPIGLSRIQLTSFKIDSASGNYFSAINHFETYKSLEDSLYNAVKSKQVSELQIQYETAKKEKSIAYLEKKDQVNKAALQRLNLYKNLTLAGILVLLIIVGLVYNGFRLKKRSNISLQAKQEEINAQNHSLQELNKRQKLLLTEKEWLLREIHHRVKNNMQTTMSLLNMQTSYLSNTDAIDAIRNSQRRMYAMSIVHQKLYQSENLATIDMPAYIKELVSYLKESFQVAAEIKFEMHLKFSELDLALAIPVGLIINEAVTNAIKYAFPGKKEGKITIRFGPVDKDTFSLCIADNGVGLPEPRFFEPGNSLGLNLIKGLADQIQGELEMLGTPGMSLKVTFKNIKETLV